MTNKETSKFDPIQRAKEKQAYREADELALKNGEKTPEELTKENGHFSRYKFKIVWDKIRKLY